MSADPYAGLRRTASSLIRKYGGPATVTQTTMIGVNGSTDTAVKSTLTAQVRCVVMPTGMSANTFRADSRIGAKYRTAYVAAADIPFTMKEGDTVTAGGVQYQVQSVSDLNPAGTGSVLFTVSLAALGAGV